MIICPDCGEKFKNKETYFAHAKTKRDKRQQLHFVCDTTGMVKSRAGVWRPNPA